MMLSQLPLLIRLRNIIGNLFAHTIRCCVPEPSALRDFVSRPPTGSARLHCTMIIIGHMLHFVPGIFRWLGSVIER
ncbi:tubby-related protein 4-like [Rhynchophorus ferrugineus]|uniref:tubby-related protein 4-like n=1 Tax=Rhynchophorus ferrugineus TaxID=354439 RepID=UPI003FCD5C0A